MAETSSIDARTHNGHADFHQPRPRKPARVDLLKPHLGGDDLLKANGSSKDIGSGLSRSVEPALGHTLHALTRTVAALRQYPQMRRPPYMHLPLRAARFEPSRSSAYSPLSNMLTVFPTSIPRATTGTSMVFLSCSGSAWRLWSSQQCSGT